MLAHIGWVFLLYAWLTCARAAGGQARRGRLFVVRAQPRGAAGGRAHPRNLANQFELPVIFYALVVLLVALGKVTMFDVIAAWVFVAGRVIHTLVQTLTDNVPLRGQVFMINFLAVAGVGRARRAARASRASGRP